MKRRSDDTFQEWDSTLERSTKESSTSVIATHRGRRVSPVPPLDDVLIHEITYWRL